MSLRIALNRNKNYKLQGITINQFIMKKIILLFTVLYGLNSSAQAVMETTYLDVPLNEIGKFIELHKKVVDMNLIGRVETAAVTLDGQKALEIFTKEKLSCKISDRSINLIKIENETFPSILRQKLGWGM